ncbi:hypothetical protein T440DRAFT_498990 [Plenodomus tracheiphilus IPT5]|uniref:Uncharacterized protein n=1 Tax=Plenodomus tracheiphilus IPT5 TaxID=1408161 RepID=A0A6A7B8X3_9PLEO|nr:hypothetical protein T440DRAFT_498990 [Plenodomus tracheiphilus IPT5]
MPPFLHHLRRRFSRNSERTHPYSMPPLQRGAGRLGSGSHFDQDDRHSTDTMCAKSLDSRSLQEALPIITDRGPPGRNRYANEDLFWNSIMLEADHDPAKYPWRSMIPSQKPGFHDIDAAVNSNLESPNAELLNEIREEIHKDPLPRPPVRRYTDLQTNGVRESTLRRHEVRRSRTDNDLIVMMAQSPNSESLLPVPLPRSRPPALSTIEEDLEHAYNPPTRGVRLSSHSAAGQSTDNERPQDDKVLTWNSVLNQILANDAVDPLMKERVHERVNASSTTNGSGHSKHPVTAIATGLVPNFSRPIYGSGFYSREDVEIEVQSDAMHATEQMATFQLPNVHSLHAILLGLQDRNISLEEDLIPRISYYLSDKTEEVDSLLAETAFQTDQIAELKHCIGYMNRILRGCWSREWEIWYTTLDIRRRRLANVGTLRRLFSRRVGRRVGRLALEERDMQGGMPKGYPCGSRGPEMDFVVWDEEKSVVGRRGVAEKELDALMLMAKQNVDILKEDMEEVVCMIKDFWWNIRDAKGKEREREEEEQGSWRDV